MSACNCSWCFYHRQNKLGGVLVTLEESKTKPEEIKSMYNDLTKDIVPSSSEEYELKDKIKSYLESPTVPKMNEIKEFVNKIRQESKKREETHIEQVESLLDMITSKPSINVITQKRKRGRPKKSEVKETKPRDEVKETKPQEYRPEASAEEEVKETKPQARQSNQKKPQERVRSIDEIMMVINIPLMEEIEEIIKSKVGGEKLLKIVRKFPPTEGVSLDQMKMYARELRGSEPDAYGFGSFNQKVYKLNHRNIFFIDSRNGLIFFRISEDGKPEAVDIYKLYYSDVENSKAFTDRLLEEYQHEASDEGGVMLAGEMSKFSKDKAIDYFLKYASQREKFRSGDDKYRYEKGDKKAIKQLKSIYNINKSFKALSTLSRLVNEYGNDFVKKYKDALRPAVRKMFKPTK